MRPAIPVAPCRSWSGHEVVKHLFATYQKDYHGFQADAVRNVVTECYRLSMICRIIQTEEMVRFVSRERVEKQLRSPSALTSALLGMAGENALIARQTAQKIGRKDAGCYR